MKRAAYAAGHPLVVFIVIILAGYCANIYSQPIQSKGYHFFIDSSCTLSATSIAHIPAPTINALPSIPYNGSYDVYPIWIFITPPILNNFGPIFLRFTHALLDSVNVYAFDSGSVQLHAVCGYLQKKWVTP